MQFPGNSRDFSRSSFFPGFFWVSSGSWPACTRTASTTLFWWCLYQGWKWHIFGSAERFERCFPEHPKDMIFWSWGVWWDSGINLWKLLLFRHFLAPKCLFCYAILSFFYCILSVLFIDNMHACQSLPFFLSKWHRIRGSVEDFHPFFIANFEQILHVVLVFQLLTLNK